MVLIRKQSALSLCTIGLMALLAGCSWMPEWPSSPPSSEEQIGDNYIQMAPEAPPSPLHETMPAYNPQIAIWRPGHWSWNGSSFDWVSGEVIARPSPTAVWSSDHWVLHTYGWAFEPGYWQ